MLVLIFATLASLPSPPQAVRVQVHGSIEATLRHVLPVRAPSLSTQVARLLHWQGDVVHQIHPGDQLALAFVDGPLGPELIATIFAGKALSLHAYRFTDATGTTRYYDSDGQTVSPWVTDGPLRTYAQITEVVQRGRGKRTHAGIDFKAQRGTPVVTPWPGVVTRINWSTRLNGRCVELAHAGGRRTLYLHLSRIAEDLSPGKALAAQTPIGYVGSSGRSSAPHLHYEVRGPDGLPLNPLQEHELTRFALQAEDLRVFTTVRRVYEGLMASAISGAAAISSSR